MHKPPAAPAHPRRRLLLAAAAAALPALAQQRVRRIGYLSLETPGSDSSAAQQRLLREGLRQRGFDEGRNLAIDWRFTAGRSEQLLPLARELVRSDVEVIVAAFAQSVAAAHEATRQIPVVMMGTLVPVELGQVRSLATPGGNLTGTVYMSPETSAKLLELLKEVRPGLRRVAMFGNTAVPGKEHFTAMYARAAATLGLSLRSFGATRPEAIPGALEEVARSDCEALFLSGDSVINPASAAIAKFAVTHRLPSIGTAQVHVRSGLLMYYGPAFAELMDRVAAYTARILHGASPAELPIEEPTRFELVVNLKTAHALSLRLPLSLQARADRFIE